MDKREEVAFPEYYPTVKLIVTPLQNVKSSFQPRPTGITIHYTAARSWEGVVQALKARDLNYHLLIDREGNVIQTAVLNKRVNHAGKASWLGKSPNLSHIAIALLNWGRLDEEKKTWAGKKLPQNEVAMRKNYYWDRCTNLQEEGLITVLRWFMAVGIDPDHICGHDECALPAGRKIDPGGILSATMPEIRSELNDFKRRIRKRV